MIKDTQQPLNKLSFVREYFEVYGGVEIHSLPNYIKLKVHQTLNLNINLPKEELIAAAKVSVGKDQSYWLDVSHKGASEIFDLDKELLPFVHAPERYAKEKFDAQLMETFYRKVNELLGQQFGTNGNLSELANLPASVLGHTDVPFYQNNQMLMQKAILLD